MKLIHEGSVADKYYLFERVQRDYGWSPTFHRLLSDRGSYVAYVSGPFTIVEVTLETLDKPLVTTGVAQKSPRDPYSEEAGINIALMRALRAFHKVHSRRDK